MTQEGPPYSGKREIGPDPSTGLLLGKTPRGAGTIPGGRKGRGGPVREDRKVGGRKLRWFRRQPNSGRLWKLAQRTKGLGTPSNHLPPAKKYILIKTKRGRKKKILKGKKKHVSPTSRREG